MEKREQDVHITRAYDSLRLSDKDMLILKTLYTNAMGRFLDAYVKEVSGGNTTTKGA